MDRKSEIVTLNGPTSSTELHVPVLTCKILTLLTSSRNCTSDSPS